MKGSSGAFVGLLEELDLSITQIKTLDAVNGCASELSVKELSERLGMSLPSASRTVEALLQRGWLERREDEHDRRVKRIRATDAGRERGRARQRRPPARASSTSPSRSTPNAARSSRRRCRRRRRPTPDDLRQTMGFSLPSIDEDNRRWWTLGAMCFALFMIMLDNTVVNVALPSIQRDLHASHRRRSSGRSTPTR